MIHRTSFLILLLVMVACQPAPEPPTPTPETIPAVTVTASATAAPPPAVTVPPEPATLTAVPVSTSTPTPNPHPVGTDTPEPYPPLATAEMVEPPESFVPEGDTAALPRLGVAATLGDGFVMCDGRTWQWWWSASMAKKTKDCEGVTTIPEHVPMLTWSPSTFESQRALNTAVNFNVQTWLVFNECENNYQCNTSPEEAARWYHDVGVPFATGLNPDVRLIVGGANAGHCGMQWLERFVTFYRVTYGEDVPRAGWLFHIYPETWNGPNCDQPWGWSTHIYHSLDLLWAEWVTQAENIRRFLLVYGRTGDEAWVNEMGCLSPAPSVCPTEAYTIAERALHYFDTDGRFITRYAWFAEGGPGLHWPWTNLWIGSHETQLELQPIGALWLNHEPLPAIPLQIHRYIFPIVGYMADVIPARPPDAPTLDPYPGPGELHP